MTSSEPQKKKEENETYRERTFMQRDNKTLPANGESGGLRWDEVKKSRKSDAAELPHHKVPPPRGRYSHPCRPCAPPNPGRSRSMLDSPPKKYPA